MNTVAIPALDFSRSAAILDNEGPRGDGRGSGLGGFGGGLRIDLFVGAPILKGGRGRVGEGVVLSSEGKSVRFKDEQEEHGMFEMMRIDGKDNGARVERKFDPRFDVAVENGMVVSVLLEYD